MWTTQESALDGCPGPLSHPPPRPRSARLPSPSLHHSGHFVARDRYRDGRHRLCSRSARLAQPRRRRNPLPLSSGYKPGLTVAPPARSGFTHYRISLSAYHSRSIVTSSRAVNHVWILWLGYVSSISSSPSSASRFLSVWYLARDQLLSFLSFLHHPRQTWLCNTLYFHFLCILFHHTPRPFDCSILSSVFCLNDN